MIRSVVVAIAAAAALTACVGGSDPEPRPSRSAAMKVAAPKAGDCLAEADSKLDRADPDFSTKVKCTKPHLYEVTGVSPVPDRFLDAPGDPGAAIRDRLLGQVGPDRRDFARYADATCSNHLWHALGVDADDVRSGNVRLSEIGAVPATSGITYLHTLTPEPEWTNGRHDLICFAEFRDPSESGGPATPAAVRSYNLAPVTAKFLSSHFPVERRRCLMDSAENGEDLTPCSHAHDAEMIFTYNARLAFGLPFAKKAIRAEGRDKQILDRTAKLCQEIVPKVLDSRMDRRLFVWGWASLDTYAAEDFNSYLTYELGDYPIECQVWSLDNDFVLSPGTVVHRPDHPALEDRRDRSDA